MDNFLWPKKTAGAGSHMHMLIRIVERTTDGPILELGAGQFSTPILDVMCAEKNRKIVTYEAHPKYYEVLKTYESCYHEVHFVEDWDRIDIDHLLWTVALVDHNPLSRRRVEVDRLIGNARYVITHDSEHPDNNVEFYSKNSEYRHMFNYTHCRPWTLVLSNTENLDWLRYQWG